MMQQKFESERILIGKGRMADVYLWNGFAYKCFCKDYPEEWMKYEISIQNKINQTGLPTVQYYESEISHSIKMDYIDGISLLDRIRYHKYKNGVEDMFLLFQEVHKRNGMDLPKLNPFLEQEISRADVDDDVKKLVLRYISELPDEDILCHMDYHFMNVMYTDHGYYIIDWMNAKAGNPIYDLARSYVIMYECAEIFAPEYLEMIKERCGYAVSDLQKAIFVMAVHRLSESHSDSILQLIQKAGKE